MTAYLNPVSEKAGKAFILKGQGEVISIERQAKGFVIDVNAQTPIDIMIGNFYFIGWQAFDQNGKEYTVNPVTEDKLLSIALPSGEHTITVSRQKLKPEIIGGWISLFSLIALILFVSAMYLKNKGLNYKK